MPRQWFHDAERYTEWALNVREVLIRAEEVLEADSRVNRGKRAMLPVSSADPHYPKRLEEAMRTAASGLRVMADHLDRAVGTGFGNGGFTPLPSVPDTEQ